MLLSLVTTALISRAFGFASPDDLEVTEVSVNLGDDAEDGLSRDEILRAMKRHDVSEDVIRMVRTLWLGSSLDAILVGLVAAEQVQRQEGEDERLALYARRLPRANPAVPTVLHSSRQLIC